MDRRGLTPPGNISVDRKRGRGRTSKKYVIISDRA